MRPTQAPRVLALIAISALSGLLIGTAAAIVVVPFAAPIGGIFGVVIGLAVSPAMVAGLLRKPLSPSLAFVVLPTMLVAVVGALAKSPGPPLLSVLVFISMPFAVAMVVPDQPQKIRRGICVACGYQVGNLSRCPECGREADPTICPASSLSPSRSRARFTGAAAIALLGFALPLVAAAFLAYERQRPKSTSELIVQLGENDMQLQWEARDALKKQGIAPLRQALKHPSPTGRANALWALGDIGDPSVLPEVRALLNDPDPYVRDQARRTVSTLESIRSPAPR